MPSRRSDNAARTAPRRTRWASGAMPSASRYRCRRVPSSDTPRAALTRASTQNGFPAAVGVTLPAISNPSSVPSSVAGAAGANSSAASARSRYTAIRSATTARSTVPAAANPERDGLRAASRCCPTAPLSGAWPETPRPRRADYISPAGPRLPGKVSNGLSVTSAMRWRS